MSNFSLAALASRTCEQCGTIFVPPKRSSKYCAPPCFHKAQEKTKINHPKKGDIPGLINKDKSPAKAKAAAFLKDLEEWSVETWRLSPQTQSAIRRAQDLVDRSNGI